MYHVRIESFQRGRGGLVKVNIQIVDIPTETSLRSKGTLPMFPGPMVFHALDPDDILITETGYKFLSERLPRNPDEIEKIMADAAAQRAKKPNKDND